MFANYLKIAWRQTVKHPAFSFINVFGLASSMAICLFLILLLEDAHSYDKFHKEGDRIYRINTEAIRTDGRREDYASSPYVIGDALARECPYIESWAMCNSTIGSEFVVGNDRFRGRTYFTNKSFLEVGVGFGYFTKSKNNLTHAYQFRFFALFIKRFWCVSW